MSPVWLNGELIDADRASVSIADHGLTVGDGVFETLRTERGTPFAMTRHLARLRRSLAGLGLELDRGDDELRGAMVAVAAAFSGPSKVRVTVTAGAGPLGSGRDDGPLTVWVAGAALDPWPATASIATVPWTRNPQSAVVGLKTTSYAENVVALRDARARDADEAVLANTLGHLCEGTGSNVFVVHDGVVRTPALSSGCLAGITRALVVELGDIEETDIPFAELLDADEVFLTSSTRDVHPVAAIDGASRPVGPVTAGLARAFADLASGNVDP